MNVYRFAYEIAGTVNEIDIQAWTKRGAAKIARDTKCGWPSWSGSIKIRSCSRVTDAIVAKRFIDWIQKRKTA